MPPVAVSGGSAINAAPASSKGKGPPALARSSLFFHASALASFLYGKQTALAEPGDALDRATVLERELLAFASTDLEAALRSWLPRANKRAKTFKSGVSRKDKVALPAIHFVERTLGGDPEADVNPDEQVSAPLSLHADSDRLWASDVVIGAGLAAFVHGRGRKYPHNQHLIAWYETSIASTDWFAQAAALCAIDLSKPKTITAFKTEPSTPLLASAQENKKGKKGKKQKGKGKQASGGKKKGKGKGKGKDKEATGEFGLPLPRPKREWKAPMPARLPEKDKRNVLITSALPYVNNVPHLGNIIGCVLSADVYARYCRLRDYNVIYICGTDEYGTATETKAVQENLTPQQICDKYHAIHAEIYRWFDISFDHFGRTTTPQQTQIAQDIFLKNDANGNVVEKEMSQLWCDTCSKFLADRFVEGTCSNADCRYEDARGDQCDKCSRLLNATELLDPRCKFCRNTPVVKQSTHLFLNLPHLEIDLIDHLLDVDANAPARMATFCEEHHGFVPPPRDEADDDEAYNAQLTAALREHVRKINKARDAPVQPVPEGNIWTSNSTSTTMDWLNRGLQPRPITRDLRWGTPVPREGYENKVFYVWFDAPIGYISITANYTEQWEQWWKAGNKGDRVDPSSDEPEVELVQFMGKDNIPFHTVIFPMSLIGARDNYTVLSSISTTEYLNYEDTKFSKSRGTGVFGNDAKATGIPSEVWRYYLLAVRPEGGDTSFSWQDFARRNNSDLLNNFGNFVNRAVAFTVARFDGKVPARSADAMTDGDRETIAAVEEETRKYIELLEALKIRDGLRSLMAVSSIGNTYLQENKPWDLLKQGPEAVQRCQNVLNIALHIVHHCAILAQPYMPTVSDRIVAQLNLPGAGDLGSDVLRLGDDGHLNLEALAAGHKLGEPELLFASIPDEAVTAFRERFAGKQDVSPDAAAGGVECTARFVAAQVKSVEAHPSSDTLYVLKLDAGEFGDDRQVVSGLVQHYKPEELQGQRVVLFENIKPSKFRKVMSHGMILCADDNGRLGLLRVDDSVAPGTVLAPSGAKLAPVAKFNTKKNMADLGLAVNAQGTVDCQGLPLEPAPVPDTRRGDFASGTKVR